MTYEHAKGIAWDPSNRTALALIQAAAAILEADTGKTDDAQYAEELLTRARRMIREGRY